MATNDLGTKASTPSLREVFATVPDLGGGDDAPPPAYGDSLDQLQLSQAGFEAGAAVTDDGRVNISINQKNRRLSELLAPTLRKQLLTESEPLPPPYIPASLGGLPGQVPPPPMNIVIQIVGSRGDVQPFVALGQVLRDTYGHRVRLATHPTFQKFVEENGLEFFSIGGDPAELMAFMVKNPGLMPGIDALKSGEIKKRRQGIEQILMGCWRSCIESGNGLGPPPRQHRPDEPLDDRFILPGNPADKPFVADAIIANPPSFAHIHIAEKLGVPLHMTFTMPWSPTRAFPHPLANIESTNTDDIMTNYLSYALVEMMTWQGLGDVINRFRVGVLDLEPLSLIWAPGLLNRLRVPTTYCWSPALIPKPADWAPEITISGFYFLNLASSYTPEPDLAAFLAAGPPPVYIGFGSIVVDNPNALTRTIFDAVAKTGVRALVSKGWGGLGTDAVGMPDGVFMLGNCPHDWLFQRVSAVVHHGGAGTSAAGIKLGKPTVVVPFFGDQPFWGAMIAKAGAGPTPIPYTKLNADNLSAAILEALRPETQARARDLGASISQEKGADVGGKSFHQFLNIDNLRCTLAPSRVAVWRPRRSKVRLSALAAAVLVKEGILKYSDLKPYRSKEYSTEDQPWDPISAVTSAFVGDIGTLTMAVADFPREIFKAGQKKNSSQAGAPTGPGIAPKEEDNAASDYVTSSTASGSGSIHSSSLPQPQQTQHNSGTNAANVGVSCPTMPASQSSATLLTSPQQTRGSSKSPSQSADGGENPNQGRSQSPFNMETAIGAGKGVGRIVNTGMQMPMNFCMGLARGFRNAPRLYGDETVRPAEKVTSFTSGLKIAGKEFGLGFYDGIAGLVTQPMKGAEQEGGAGLLKGFGKGIGGLILKPASAIWSLPAYTMQGIHAEVRNMFSKSSLNYIITSRVLQGNGDLAASTAAEQMDILMRWQTHKDDLKGLFQLKQKAAAEAAAQQQNPGGAATTASDTRDGPPPKTGWLHTRHLSIDERRKLHAEKEAWKKRQAEQRSTGRLDIPTNPPSSTASSSTPVIDEEEFERSIRAAVQQTSRGDQDEDARVEAAIRASVAEMRRIADHQNNSNSPALTSSYPVEKRSSPATPTNAAATAAAAAALMVPVEDENLTNITDEEYQALVEEAVRQSLSQQKQHEAPGGGYCSSYDDQSGHSISNEKRGHQSQYFNEKGGKEAATAAQTGAVVDDDEDLRKAIEASKLISKHDDHQLRPAKAFTNEEDDDDAQMRRALEESKKEINHVQRQLTEEETVFEYIKRQSLAEEEYRRLRQASGQQSGGDKGKGTEVSPMDEDEDEYDADLKRALAESLRAANGNPGAGGGQHSKDDGVFEMP
ncbi:glycosyltransferase family 28 domain-containing protein [Podospora didyma]|uniref:Glycosyltransferase family 28 domain-containing protein n=1 Tax=Podospora didyma TaxID=330526 RepID=A0AAE0P6D3_9PEZI|nr:glycosyltransferase family 28 domain-containing protein [Podospora didyma]